MSDDWDGIDRRQQFTRRHPEDPNAAFLEYISGQLECVNAKLNAIHIDNINHKSETAVIKQDVESIKKAFPKNSDGNADIDGHHDYHWKLVESAKTWNDIWVDVRKKLFGGIAWAIVVFVAYSVWESVKQEVKK